MLIELRQEALFILDYSWPMVVMASIIASSLRIVYLKLNKEKFVLYKELFKLFFVIYLLCLFHAVTYQDVSFGGTNFIPFKEIFRYSFGSELFIRNILGNVLLFLPYGIFISKYLKVDKASIILILSGIVSLSIELIQLIIGRVFDVDDIILNILGALIGYFIYKLINKISNKIPILKNQIILDILSVLLVGGLVWFLIP